MVAHNFAGISQDSNPLKYYKISSWSEIKDVESPELYYLQDCDGDTQLHVTIMFKQIEASEWLISRASHPSLLDARNDDGHTPLHYAVIMDQPRLVRRLVLAGANPWITDRKGNTALHTACQDGKYHCARAILEPIDACEMPWLVPGAPVQPESIDLRNFKCETCLQLAVQRNDLELTRLLIHYGADVEAREWRGGMTPLHMAVDSNHRSMVRLLVVEGRCCLDALTYGHSSAYQVALHRDNTELAQQLLDFGASAEAGRWESDDSSSNSSDGFSGSDDDEIDPMTDPLVQDLSSLTFKKPNVPVCVLQTMASWSSRSSSESDEDSMT
ncbi:hypothetical protein QAD02_004585 [Eretmocerus hayati]|uniref:Uncharacterized protein n=1 Tax=Eretmocerus hayati TaxID=131215 RepID=A0ACC2NR75_9HYME|nr:hypothetical protein QAD02_004585 [Eretmocerus hayati]